MRTLNLYTFSELEKASPVLANRAIYNNIPVQHALYSLAEKDRVLYVRGFNDNKEIQNKLAYFCLVFAPGINRPVFDGEPNPYADIIFDTDGIDIPGTLDINKQYLYDYIKNTKEYKNLSWLDKSRIKWALRQDHVYYRLTDDEFFGAVGIEKIDDILDGFMYDLCQDFYNWLNELCQNIPHHDYQSAFLVNMIGEYKNDNSTLRQKAINQLDLLGFLFDNHADFICFDEHLKEGNIQ